MYIKSNLAEFFNVPFRKKDRNSKYINKLQFNYKTLKSFKINRILLYREKYYWVLYKFKKILQVDQGFNLNIINYSLTLKLGLLFLDIAKYGYVNIRFNTLNNRNLGIKYFIIFRININSVRRDVQVYVLLK